MFVNLHPRGVCQDFPCAPTESQSSDEWWEALFIAHYFRKFYNRTTLKSFRPPKSTETSLISDVSHFYHRPMSYTILVDSRQMSSKQALGNLEQQNCTCQSHSINILKSLGEETAHSQHRRNQSANDVVKMK